MADPRLGGTGLASRTGFPVPVAAVAKVPANLLVKAQNGTGLAWRSAFETAPRPSVFGEAGTNNPFKASPTDVPDRVLNSSNPSFLKPHSMFDLASVTFSSYGADTRQGKISLYDAGKNAEGKPVVLVNITGTEFDGSGRLSNTPANWLGAGSGARTDLERESVAAIQDAYKRGEIPKGAVLDLSGHSLGGIIANNISGRNFGIRGSSGQIPVTGPDGKQAYLPIRNVTSFGAPLPSVWSNKVNYTQRNAPGDVVSNIPTDQIGGTRLGQWRNEPHGPAHLDRQTVNLNIPDDDLADGGHLQYNKNPSGNPLSQERLPAALQYNAPLKLIAAYKDPAIEKPEAIKPEVAALSNQLLSPSVRGTLDKVYPAWRSWLSGEAGKKLQKLDPHQRNEINSGLNAFFSAYLQSDRFKNASPAEQKEIIKQDQGRIGDALRRIAVPLAKAAANQEAHNFAAQVRTRLHRLFSP